MVVGFGRMGVGGGSLIGMLAGAGFGWLLQDGTPPGLAALFLAGGIVTFGLAGCTAAIISRVGRRDK